MIEVALLVPEGAKVLHVDLEHCRYNTKKLEVYLSAQHQLSEVLPDTLQHDGFLWIRLGGLPWTWAARPQEWQHIGIYERGERVR